MFTLPERVNKHTRAGYDGKLIACPDCDKSVTVYHFSWGALMCPSCKTDVDKYDWVIACDCTIKGIGQACKARQINAIGMEALCSL